MKERSIVRCPWAEGSSPRMVAYHDDEWGVPLHDDRALFELLSLEAFQAGLSWAIVLAKRDGFRSAFKNFAIERVAAFDDARVEALVADAGIVRNRSKIRATIGNATSALALATEFGSLDEYLWRFVGGTPIVRRPATMADVPATSAESDALSKDLRARGFRFVGPTVCYAHLQAAGLVNDHLVSCFRHGEVSGD